MGLLPELPPETFGAEEELGALSPLGALSRDGWLEVEGWLLVSGTLALVGALSREGRLSVEGALAVEGAEVWAATGEGAQARSPKKSNGARRSWRGRFMRQYRPGGITRHRGKP